MFLAQLATSRAYGEMPGYHLVLVEKDVEMLIEAAGVTTTMSNIMTITTNLPAHTRDMVTMREKAVATSFKEYLACKFLLLANGERYKPL